MCENAGGMVIHCSDTCHERMVNSSKDTLELKLSAKNVMSSIFTLAEFNRLPHGLKIRNHLSIFHHTAQMKTHAL